MGLFRRGGVWWYGKFVNGRQYRLSTGKTTKKEAKAFVKQWLALPMAGASPVIVQNAEVARQALNHPGGGLTFGQVVNRYLEEFSAGRNAAGTYKRNKLSAGYLARFFGSCKLTDVSPDRVLDYRRWRVMAGKKKSSPASVNHDLKFGRRVYNWSKEMGYCSDNPFKNSLMLRVNNICDRIPTDEEWQGIVQALSGPLLEEMRVVTFIARFSGARRSEIIALKRSNIGLDEMVITFNQTKNGEPRTIPVCEKLMAELAPYLQRKGLRVEDAVFPGLTVGKVTETFRRIIRKLGFTGGLNFHSLRKAFATDLNAKGVDLYTIARLTGHKQIDMLKRYLHPSMGTLRGAILLLDRERKEV